ncbi:hypothetical protein IX51_00025 [uncultured archaeon]|nr:hypothetical protein IX51_00025 [uncultured archaeon]
MGLIRDEYARALHLDFEKSLKSDVDVVVFTNDSTEHCDSALAIVRELSRLRGTIHFMYYNVDKNLEASEAYRISGAPTTIVARRWNRMAG